MKNMGIGTEYAALIEAMPQGAVLTLNDIDWDEYENRAKTGRRKR